MFIRLIYIGLLMYVMELSCLFVFCLLCFALFVFLSLSILLVMLTYVASIDGVDTPSDNLPLYFLLCHIIVLLS